MQITVEKPQQEAYTWYALYKDDDIISEYDRPEGRGFVEVDQDRVKALVLIPSQVTGATHQVEVPHGATPIFFRRRSITIDPLQGETGNRVTTHCIGWKRGDKAMYLFIHGDGSTLLSTDLQAV
jgi:hypothetical protein